MEQSCSDSILTRDEIEVTQILLHLPGLIYDSFRRRFKWGAKRSRSALTKEQFSVASLPASVKLSPPPELPERQTEKILTSSPATPLSFSPSESDEKPPKRKKASVNTLKRKKEQLLEMMKDFTQTNESLRKDIENKKLFLDQERAKNLELKAKKEELSLSLLKEKGPPLGSMETENTQGHHHRQMISTGVYQQPLIIDRPVCKSEINFSSEYPYNGMISWLQSNAGGLIKVHDNIGPLGFLDLNVPAEEVFGFVGSPRSVDPINSAKATAAARARFNRMQKCRSKNHTNSKIRCPHR